MSIIYVLIPVAITLTIIGIYAFFWAVKTEQFDDLEKEGMSILFDEQKKAENEQADADKTNKADQNSKHSNSANSQ